MSPVARNRRSIRVPDFDYTYPGPYFITIVTAGRVLRFGEIANGEMLLNQVGQMVRSEWLRLPFRFPGLEIDEYVVMPNHFHGILSLPDKGDQKEKVDGQVVSCSVGAVIRAFKAATTERFHFICGWNAGILWQRNYHEHIVRRDVDYNRIREYILCNPSQWEADREWSLKK